MFEVVADESELWVGEMRGCVLHGVRLLLVRLEQGYVAYHDRCPHQGVPLSEGELRSGVITCRAHLHTFDAATGGGINPERPCLRGLAVRVEAGRVLVEPPTRLGVAP